MLKHSEFLNLQGLKRRGWTTGQVKRFLGQPDRTERNPAYRRAPRVRLYRVTRVLEVEALPEFIAAMNKVEAMRARSRDKARERSGVVRQAVEDAEITVVEGKTRREIQALAAASRYAHLYMPRFRFTDAMAVRFISVHLTNIEDEYWAVRRASDDAGVDPGAGYRLLRERIDAAVRDNYPEFFTE